MKPTGICWDWWVVPIVRGRCCSLQPRPVWGTKDVFDRALEGIMSLRAFTIKWISRFPNWSKAGGDGYTNSLVFFLAPSLTR